jgi:tetratricopeptide (TPR) repeat protein
MMTLAAVNLPAAAGAQLELTGARLPALEAHVHSHPDDVPALHQLIAALLDHARTSQAPADYQRAAEALARATQLAPDHPQTIALTAWSEMNAHRFSAALVHAQAALQREPDSALALGIAADAATELGAYDRAVAWVDTLLTVHPALPAWTRAAHLRFVHGDIAGALDLTQAAARSARAGGPDAWWSALQMSELLLAAGEFDAAGRWARAAHDSAKALAQPLAQLARVAEGAGQFDAALALYRQAAAIQRNPDYSLGMLRAALATGNATEVRRQRSILDGMGRLDEISGGLFARTFAEARLLQGDLAGAERLARSELARRPDIYSHSQLAWILLARGEVADAQVYAQASLATGSADPLLMCRAGRVLARGGAGERAERLVERALTLNPGLGALCPAQLQPVALTGEAR